MRLKLGVSPLIIIPIATKASNLFIFLAITTGISKAPLTNSDSIFLIFLLINSS